MTTLSLYLTVKDTLGRVTAEIYIINDRLQQEEPNEPTKANMGLTERAELLDKKLRQRYAKRNELRRKAKGGS